MIYDVIIIGAGPAGITAGIYAKRANLNVAVFEKGAPGGQILSTAEIENYPGFKKTTGFELASSMFEHLLELGVEVFYEAVTSVLVEGDLKIVKADQNVYQTKSVLFATGAIPRRLGVKGEDQFASNGISWCAICDGPLYKDKDVVVIGGGNSAVEESLFLSNIVKHITLVQNLGHLTADPKAVNLLKKVSNIRFIYEAKVKEFIGDNGLTHVLVENKDGEELIKADGAFEYVGLEPVTSFALDLGITNTQGYIKVNDNMSTNIPGIFSAGDVNQKQIRQIVTAVSDGAVAIQNITKYLESL